MHDLCYLNVSVSFIICIIPQGELWHRRVKRLWASSNKRDAGANISRQERRETLLKRSAAMYNASAVHSHHIPFEKSEPLPLTEIEMHHHISDSTQSPLNLYQFAAQTKGDPATKVSFS